MPTSIQTPIVHRARAAVCAGLKGLNKFLLREGATPPAGRIGDELFADLRARHGRQSARVICIFEDARRSAALVLFGSDYQLCASLTFANARNVAVV